MSLRWDGSLLRRHPGAAGRGLAFGRSEAKREWKRHREKPRDGENPDHAVGAPGPCLAGSSAIP